jgi:hypothetical protein
VGVVLAVVAFLWLALLTLGLIGINVRISIVRRDLLMATGRLPASGSGSAARAGTGLSAGTLVLLVSETCVTCTEAIEALHAAVTTGRLTGRQVYVLSPDPDDPRVTPPLALLSDDELYRHLHGSKVPELVEIGEHGEPAHRLPVPSGDELLDRLGHLEIDLTGGTRR